MSEAVQRDVNSELFNDFINGFAEFLSKNLGQAINPPIIKEEHKKFNNFIYEYGFSIKDDEIKYFTPDDKLFTKKGKAYCLKRNFKKVPSELKEVIIEYYSRILGMAEKEIKKYMKQYSKVKKKILQART